MISSTATVEFLPALLLGEIVTFGNADVAVQLAEASSVIRSVFAADPLLWGGFNAPLGACAWMLSRRGDRQLLLDRAAVLVGCHGSEWEMPVRLDPAATTDDDVVYLCRHFGACVTALSLQSCAAISSAALTDLHLLGKLRSLNIDDCWVGRLTRKGLAHVFALPTLTELSISGCAAKDGDLAKLASASTLMSLRMDCCESLTGACLANLAASGATHSLTTLSVMGLHKFGAAEAASLTAFQSLTALDVSRCVDITDKCMRSLVSLTQLRALHIGGAYLITDKGIEALAVLRGTLETLNMDWLKLVTDAGLTTIATELTNLTELDISNMFQVHDAGFAQLLRLPKLRKLSANYCDNVTDAGLLALVRHPTLRFVATVGCERISDTTRATLAQSLRHR